MDPAGRAALSGVFKQEGSGRSSVYREGWKRLRSFRLGGREGTALEGAVNQARQSGARSVGQEGQLETRDLSKKGSPELDGLVALDRFCNLAHLPI